MRGGWRGALVLAYALLSGCATTRVVPVPASGVTLDPAQGTAQVAEGGVELVVRPSAWRGSPSYLPGYVTPFHVTLTNASGQPLRYDYPDLRLFDEARFQYTALPPVEVERILRSAGAWEPRLAMTAEADARPVVRRRFVERFWWDPWWGWPYPYPFPYSPPRLDDVYLQALAVGPLDAGARREGFVYFPRLRPDVSRLTLEFHYRLGPAGEVERVLALPFGVER